MFRQRRRFRDSGGFGVAHEGFAPLRVAGICALWALAHSVLASKQAKGLARRISGPRYRDGLYRFAFNAQSLVSLVWAALRFSRLPDRELYRVGPPTLGSSGRARLPLWASCSRACGSWVHCVSPD